MAMTDDEVVAILKAAIEAVAKAGVADDLRPAAFKIAASLLGGTAAPPSTEKPDREKKLKSRATGAGGGTPKGPEKDETATPRDEDDFFDRFSRESKVAQEKLRQVYYFDKGELRLSVSRSLLGDSITKKNQMAATLLAGARYYPDGERSTGIEEIRKLIETTGLDPTRNLGSHIESVAGTIHTGKGNAKAIRVQESKFRDVFSAAVDAVVDD